MRKPTGRTCQVVGCKTAEQAGGLCQAHYNRFRRLGDVLADQPVKHWRKGCLHDGCDRPHDSNGYCGTHATQMRRKGRTWDFIPKGRGGRGTLRRGYRSLWMPDHPMASAYGYVAEHRLVMSEHLGRELHSSETVHHKNGDTLDNRIENLELKSSSHKRGQTIPDLVDFAIEILERYEPTMLNQERRKKPVLYT